METITLTNGIKVLVDAEDSYKLSQFSWNFNRAGTGYAMSRGKKGVLMHRFILDAPKGVSVDHINGNTLDNRKINLRLCSHAENMANRKLHKNNTSGYKGVYFDKATSKWCAEIKKNGVKIRIGRYQSILEAALAYEDKARQLFGLFYRSENKT
jgi:hypothetical protein